MVDVLVQEITVVNCTENIVNSTEAAMQMLKRGECKYTPCAMCFKSERNRSLTETCVYQQIMKQWTFVVHSEHILLTIFLAISKLLQSLMFQEHHIIVLSWFSMV